MGEKGGREKIDAVSCEVRSRREETEGGERKEGTAKCGCARMLWRTERVNKGLGQKAWLGEPYTVA